MGTFYLTALQKIVTPVKTGVRKHFNAWTLLASAGMTEKDVFGPFTTPSYLTKS